MAMTLTPETEGRLRNIAQHRGTGPEEMIEALLNQAEADLLQIPLTISEEAQVLAALRTSVEDYVAGRWISLEDYEAEVREEQESRTTRGLHQ